MKTVKFAAAASAFGALVLCSCCWRPADWQDAWVTQDIVAAPAAEGQIRIDGEISPGEWDGAQAYALTRAKDWGYDALLPRQRKLEDGVPFERGSFKVKYDADHLYVLAELDDADVVQTSSEDQAPFFETGDVVAVILKPENQSAVWEICATPRGNVATLFYPWRGHGCRAQQKFVPGVKVAVSERKAADPEKDKAGWIVEMAIPRTLIERTGGTFAPDKEWRVLLVRRNCGKNLPGAQNSSTPMLPRDDRRLVAYYAKLKFKPAPTTEAAPAATAPADKAPAAATPAPTSAETPAPVPATPKSATPAAATPAPVPATPKSATPAAATPAPAAPKKSAAPAAPASAPAAPAASGGKAK